MCPTDGAKAQCGLLLKITFDNIKGDMDSPPSEEFKLDDTNSKESIEDEERRKRELFEDEERKREDDEAQERKEKKSIEDENKLVELMQKEHAYPDITLPDLQTRFYVKREFYFNKIPSREHFKTYEDIKEYRDNICNREFTPYSYQTLLSNFINPYTPYKGIIVFHGTGVGKCTTGGTLLTVNDQVMEIRNIWKTFKTKKIKDDTGKWSKPSEELLINCFDEKNGTMIKAPIKMLYKQKIKENINVITLENGNKIKITKAHKLLTYDGWTNNLEKGMYVCIPKYIHNSPEKQTLEVTKELAILLAWQIGEGHERKGSVMITQNEIWVLNDLIECIRKVKEHYNIEMNVPHVQPSDNRRLNLSSVNYIKFLEDNGYSWGHKSAGKSFPQFIMNSSKKIIRIFLKHYFDAEGTVTAKSRRVEISSASEVLMHQISYLLRIFGIHIRINMRMKMATNGSRIKRPYYIGLISSTSLRIYQEEIGFQYKYKKDLLDAVCEQKVNQNMDLIPIGNILTNLKATTDIPYHIVVDKQYFHGTRRPSPEKLTEICNNLLSICDDKKLCAKYNIDKTKIKAIKLCHQQLLKELNKEVYYVKIQSVEERLHTGYVYDIEVDTYHNYVANDIISHNTCSAILIAEKFKSMVQKYGTKIYVLVNGPVVKDVWKRSILECTGETYMKYQDKSRVVDEMQIAKAKKIALNLAMQYYRFMSYRSFYRKVLGERIVEKKITKDNKVKVQHRKTEEGEYERDISIDRIYNLNNSLLIVDEAHNLTGNAYGDALMKIIRNSTNLRVVLMTATPMKNLAHDIIELLNFIRPDSSPILRDRVFTSEQNHEMEFRPDGMDYFRDMCRGYISHLRGADPLTFAKRVEVGIVPSGLLFTKLIPCVMYDFQRKIYDEAIKNIDDTLDRRSQAVANSVFPGLTSDKKELTGYYGREGLATVKQQLKSHGESINKKLEVVLSEWARAEKLPEPKSGSHLIAISDSGKNITGTILQIPYLKFFSVKFYTALLNINQLVWNKKGAHTAFVYSNLVKVGIELFQEILLQNGYLEYQENKNSYRITPTTVCYYCGHTHKDHEHFDEKANKENEALTKDDYITTEDLVPPLLPPPHQFFPATFIVVTGKSSEEMADVIPEDKQRIINTVFNDLENREGKYIKLVLGSKVMNEGVSLYNTAEVHILDVYFNLGRVDQVIGRAIRGCQHYKIINDKNRFPSVKILKYSISLGSETLSSEEELYQKAELKHILVKKAERIMKEVAIDCPLNMAGNIFKEEVEEYKNCKAGSNNPCPGLCDYTSCEYICDDEKLNALYYDPDRRIYRDISKNKLDYTTFNQSLAKNEIDYAKTRVKEMYRLRYVYTLNDIIEYVKTSYDKEKRELFDDFFVFRALDDMIPLTENDFNNFQDTILDRFNKPGYLIYRLSYYIYQPFDQNEDVPMYYRISYAGDITNQISLENYLYNLPEYTDLMKETEKESTEAETISAYDFESVMEYYDNREEFDIVGVIDKELSRRKTKRPEEIKDVFKIRPRRDKILMKKRGTGIPSLKGAVCNTSKNKEYLLVIAKKLDLKVDDDISRLNVCDQIRDKLLFLEKYNTDNKTYIMIPKNHPVYPFPYNLKDRVKYIIDNIKSKIKFDIGIKQKQSKNPKTKLATYEITFSHNNRLDEFKTFLESLGGVLDKSKWVYKVE
jgi:intein/homing endonuclease